MALAILFALLLLFGWSFARRTLGVLLLLGVWTLMYPDEAGRVGARIDAAVGMVSYLVDPDDNAMPRSLPPIRSVSLEQPTDAALDRQLSELGWAREVDVRDLLATPQRRMR